MSKLTELQIMTSEGEQTVPLIEWIEGAYTYRYKVCQVSPEDLLEKYESALCVKDEHDRKLVKDLILITRRLNARIIEAAKEFKTIHNALQSIKDE